MVSPVSVKWNMFFAHIFITWCIFTPYCIWCTYKYYKYRNHIIISKRYPIVTLCFCAISVISLCIEQSLYRILWTTSNDYNKFSDVSPILLTTSIIISGLVHIIVPWLICLRFWLIYYNIEWTKSTINKKWKIHLNYLDIDKDWFLSNKSTFGNAKYLIKRVSIVALCLSILTIIIKLISSPFIINKLIQLITNIVPLLFMLIIGCKMKKFNDYFYIIKEFKLITILIYITIIVYILCSVILPQIFSWNAYITSLIFSIFFAIQSTLFVISQTIYVLKITKIDKKSDGIFERLNSNKTEIALSDIVSASNTPTAEQSVNTKKQYETQTQTDSNTINETKTIKINDTLSNSDTFELFMSHLSKEWSMELLLAFIEITQLQQQIKWEYNEFINDMKFTSLQESILANECIPSSYIVCHQKMDEFIKKYGIVINSNYDKNDKIIQLKIKMYALHIKYINDGDFQINISYQQYK
eukprot:278566_1